jgi:PAS domain S-box-containing protein
VLQKSEKALRSSEAMYRTILNNTGSATIIIEEDMTISFANPEVERIMGYSKEEIEGKRSWTEFVFPDDVEQMNRYHQLRRTNPDKAPPNYEFRVITKDRQIRNAYITIGLIPGTTKAIASFVDITENKHAEEALRQANKKLNLLSDITRHDINNQLMELRSYLAILEMKQPNPALIEYLQKAVTVAQKISTTIQFTKEYESIGVKSQVWQDCRTLIETAAKQSILGNVVVKNNLTAGAEVFADPLIVKVFYNLMENAVRYGGKVTTIRFSVEERNHDHVLVCEDDGNGVPTDEKKQIFERGVGKNTGLGLFLSREILSITGITLSETGEPGKGARFEILVPKGVYRFAEELKPS